MLVFEEQTLVDVYILQKPSEPQVEENVRDCHCGRGRGAVPSAGSPSFALCLPSERSALKMGCVRFVCLLQGLCARVLLLEKIFQIFSLLQFGKQPRSDSSGCFSGIYCCPAPSVQAVPPVVLGFVQSQCASFPLLLFGKCTLLVLHVLPRWAEPWDAWSTSWPGILAPCPCLE